MKNLMAKQFVERCQEYLHTPVLEERGAKVIYFWVMSQIEAYFWGFWELGRTYTMDIDLFARGTKIYLLFRHRTGRKYEAVFSADFNCENLAQILKNFVEIFNNVKYPVLDKTPSPCVEFRAEFAENWKEQGDPYGYQKRFNGYYYIKIFVDMCPIVE